MQTLEYTQSLTAEPYKRQEGRKHEWGGYRGHDIRLGSTIVATVFVYDNGRRTYEFDNEICYTKELLAAVIVLGNTLTSGKGEPSG